MECAIYVLEECAIFLSKILDHLPALKRPCTAQRLLGLNIPAMAHGSLGSTMLQKFWGTSSLGLYLSFRGDAAKSDRHAWLAISPGHLPQLAFRCWKVLYSELIGGLAKVWDAFSRWWCGCQVPIYDSSMDGILQVQERCSLKSIVLFFYNNMCYVFLGTDRLDFAFAFLFVSFVFVWHWGTPLPDQNWAWHYGF